MTPTRATGAGLRELTRRTVRAQIADRAMELFLVQGFEETTVEQIAAEVGMSARSVFRYFDTKEDMVVGTMLERGAALAEELDRRPVTEDAWQALRAALHTLLAEMTADRECALARSRMFASTESLRAARQQKQVRWRELLTPGVLSRLPVLPDEPPALRSLRASAVTATVLACLDVAAAHWTQSNGTDDLAALLDTAIAAVRAPATGAPHGAG
jgi:AcrR family transcriptional regulator